MSRGRSILPLVAAVCALGVAPVAAQTPVPNSDDPFAGISPAQPDGSAQPHQDSWLGRLLHENLGFRGEIMSEFTSDGEGSNASRQSAGFEVLKKFSTATSTVASFDFQGRFVRRDGYNPVPNDMEGATRPGWAFEYHNF